MDYTITCGPFVGSFFEEIFVFRPFVEWIQYNLLFDDMFIFTHQNRSFLYNRNVIPIYEQYSLDDTKMCYHKNKDINAKLYDLIYKSLIKDVVRITGITQKEIISVFNRYSKNRVSVSEYNKLYTKIKTPDIEIDLPENYTLFIPNKNESKNNLKTIYDNFEDLIVLGDGKIFMQNKNIIKENMWFDLYKYIIKIINNASLVICPASEWTFLCNLQNIPVISWGKKINQYKTNEIYSFNNKCCVISGNNPNIIINQIKYFKNKL